MLAESFKIQWMSKQFGCRFFLGQAGKSGVKRFGNPVFYSRQRISPRFQTARCGMSRTRAFTLIELSDCGGDHRHSGGDCGTQLPRRADAFESRPRLRRHAQHRNRYRILPPGSRSIRARHRQRRSHQPRRFTGNDVVTLSIHVHYAGCLSLDHERHESIP